MVALACGDGAGEPGAKLRGVAAETLPVTENPALETLRDQVAHVLADLRDAVQVLARLDERVTRIDDTLTAYRPLLEQFTGGGAVAAYTAARRARRNGG